jgi:CelD/BcsL family acetyltransferase involved in cellulose biosynthesis
VRILAARAGDGTLAGLLPLCESRELAAGIPVRRLGFLGDSEVGSEYLEPLSPRGREAELAELFAEWLASRRQDFDVLELLDLAKGSIFGTLVMQRLKGRALRLEREARCVCPVISLTGDWESYLKAMGRADNLARRRKWLEAQPGFQMVRTEAMREVPAALSEFFRLHRLRWDHDGGSQGIRSPKVHAFHRDAAALFAENGWLRLYTLKLGGAALASVYGVVYKDRFYYYQSGYDPAWARRSVGLVLLGETVREAFADERTTFDFLRGVEPYKLEWAQTRRETEVIRIIAPTAGGAAYLAWRDGTRAIRRAARRILGEWAWGALGLARRRSSR